MWNKYQPAILKKMLIPYMMFMVLSLYFATSAMTEFVSVVNGEQYEQDSKMCFELLKIKLYMIAFISMYFWIFFARIELL